ncbi:MAG: imidazoleglycerol-phosphate dehydratase HisB [Pirellulaceae bacterium]
MNSSTRSADASRKTNETDIQCRIEIGGEQRSQIATGLGFLDHMLDALAKHSQLSIDLTCDGDVHVDDHHTVEDCAIVLGKTLSTALNDRSGIRRFGHAYAPLDEALARAVIDFSGRPHASIELGLCREKIGDVASENLTHFFQTFAFNANCSLHVDVLKGANDHHRAEAAFKATALAIRSAIEIVGDGIASTKGSLT